MTADFYRFILLAEIVVVIMFSVANANSYLRHSKTPELRNYLISVVVARILIYVVLLTGILTRLGEELNWRTPALMVGFGILILTEFFLFNRSVNSIHITH